ncbi:MAG: hypothetical protein R6U92_08250 [Bacillota bacterium]
MRTPELPGMIRVATEESSRGCSGHPSCTATEVLDHRRPCGLSDGIRREGTRRKLGRSSIWGLEIAVISRIGIARRAVPRGLRDGRLPDE